MSLTDAIGTTYNYYIHKNDHSIYKNSPIFSQTFYLRNTSKGAGFRKYIVQAVYYLPKNPIKDIKYEVSVMLEATFKKTITIEKMIFVNHKLLANRDKIVFKNVVDYFVYIENCNALYVSHIKAKTQYQFELKQIQNKYPEHFL